MLIGIDASKAGAACKTGVENVVYRLILHLGKIDSKNRYRLYTDRPLDPELLQFKNFEQKLMPFFRFWNKVRLPAALLRDKPEVFLEPGYMIPPFAPKKTAVIIHDLAYRFFPEAYSKRELFLLRAAERRAKKAARLIFVSKKTAADFLKFNSFPQEKTAVICPGYDSDLFYPKKWAGDILNLKTAYFLFVGRLEERKNVKNILKAFSIYKEKTGGAEKIVLAGQPGRPLFVQQALDEAGKYASSVVMPGFVSPRLLPDLYGGAKLLVFPSLYEGFGLPVLEAFASGLPVLTSNVSSLPEVAGAAALTVDPKNPEAIAAAMERLVSDLPLRERLIERGLVEAKKYRWQKMAEKVLAVLLEMK